MHPVLDTEYALEEIGAVRLDHLAGLLLADHVDQVGARLQGRDGREVGRARVHEAAAEDADAAALALVQVVRQLGNHGPNLLQNALRTGLYLKRKNRFVKKNV